MTFHMDDQVQKLFQAAMGYHQAGQLAQAGAFYQQILQIAPNHPDALYLSGLIAHDMGQNETAAKLIGKAIDVNPVFPFYYSLGNVFHALGRLDEAAASFRQALRLKPDLVDAHLNLANTLRAQGKLDDAAVSFRQALRLKPGLVDAHLNLGNVLRAQDRLDEAAESFRNALRLKPDYAEVHNNLGNVLKEQGKLDAAIESFRQALAFRPDYAEAGFNLGSTFLDDGKLEAAIACYREVLRLNPDMVDTHVGLGKALQQQGDPEAATGSFHKALALKPDCIDACLGLAGVHQDAGQFAVAKEYLDRVLELKPDHPSAWGVLPFLRKMTVEDLPWAETAQRLLESGLEHREEMGLCYALGKYNDDTRQYEAAFTYYNRANRLKRQLADSFDRDEHRRSVDAIIAAHPAEAMRGQAGGSASRRPLFIVGMPRSGTSLTEQILASHPEVFGAGELRFWGQQAQKHLSTMPSWHRDLPLQQDLAKQCEAELQRHSATALRVVDKMPYNFLHLGLIHAAFPEARILHTRRNPIDTCLSIYFQGFSSRHTYANDLDNLAFYYREYHRLMAHWRAVLPPEVFLDVPYEELVEDQEGWSRRIIGFAGLEWDERCLDFHETERKVGTASNWQVRQKIYKTSKERWRNYEKFVGPLLPLLELA